VLFIFHAVILRQCTQRNKENAEDIHHELFICGKPGDTQLSYLVLWSNSLNCILLILNCSWVQSMTWRDKTSFHLFGGLEDHILNGTRVVSTETLAWSLR